MLMPDAENSLLTWDYKPSSRRSNYSFEVYGIICGGLKFCRCVPSSTRAAPLWVGSVILGWRLMPINLPPSDRIRCRAMSKRQADRCQINFALTFPRRNLSCLQKAIEQEKSKAPLHEALCCQEKDLPAAFVADQRMIVRRCTSTVLGPTTSFSYSPSMRTFVLGSMR